MSEEVGIRYTVDGTQEAAAGVDSVTAAFGRNNQQLDASKEQVDAFEAAMSSLTERGEATAAMHRRLAAAQGENVQQGAQFITRFAGMASAVASVAGALGGESETAGLVARLAAGAAQAISMGAAFGPAGALVTGITTLVPLIATMAGGVNDAAESTSILTERQEGLTSAIGGSLDEIDQYIERVNDLESANRRAGRIAEGLGTEDEQFAAANLAGRRVGVLSAQISDLRRQERALSGSVESIEDSDRLEDITARRLSLESDLVAARAESQRLGQLALQVHSEELEIAEDLLTIGNDDRREAEEERLAREEHAASMAARRRQEREDAEALRRIMRDSDEAIAFAATQRTEFQQNAVGGGSDDVDRSGGGSQRTTGQGGAGGVSAQMEQQRALGRLEAQMHDDRVRKQQLYVQSIQDEIGVLNSAGEQLGSMFSGAFQAAIQGQTDFGQAVEQGIKQILLNYGTQMVAEGAGALLTGIGNAIFNPPAAAAKLVEGAGKIALGVGLGAAGAAIPSASSGGPAEAPRGPAANGAATGGNITYNTNLNAPVVMGGTHAEVGRSLERQREAGMRRYAPRRGRMAA